jgi:hypothetical protein
MIPGAVLKNQLNELLRKQKKLGSKTLQTNHQMSLKKEMKLHKAAVKMV